MLWDRYKTLLTNRGAKRILSKPYGLELLFVLEACAAENADNGIEDTYELLGHFAPRRAAFSNFIKTLESEGHIVKTVSPIKASKNILRLAKDVGKAFKAFKAS